MAAPSLSEATLNKSLRLAQNNKLKAAESVLIDALKKIPDEKKEVFYFQLGLTQMGQQKYNEAALNFQLALDQKGNLEDYITFFMAQNADKNNDQKGAEELFEKS